VTRGNKAWTAAEFNPVAVQIELCGFAAWTRDEWLNHHDNMLRNCADWWREEAGRFGLPIEWLSATAAQGSGHGGCEHEDFGVRGGGHVDCGPGFPKDYVISLARNEIKVEPEDEEIGPMQLEFWKPPGDADPRAGVAIPKEKADGKHKLRLMCAEDTYLRVDWGNRTDTLQVSSSRGARSSDIPEGADNAIVRRDSGDGPVDMTISKR
jgi:hypothetical protein